MIYGITILLSVLYVWILCKTRSVTGHVLLLGFLTIYGRYIFQNFSDVYESYYWSSQNPDGTLTYSFVEVAIDQSWSNPEYWNYLVMEANTSAWWIIWPIYFVILFLISRYIGVKK
jgi:hypothetical protein